MSTVRKYQIVLFASWCMHQNGEYHSWDKCTSTRKEEPDAGYAMANTQQTTNTALWPLKASHANASGIIGHKEKLPHFLSKDVLIALISETNLIAQLSACNHPDNASHGGSVIKEKTWLMLNSPGHAMSAGYQQGHQVLWYPNYHSIPIFFLIKGILVLISLRTTHQLLCIPPVSSISRARNLTWPTDQPIVIHLNQCWKIKSIHQFSTGRSMKGRPRNRWRDEIRNRGGG